MRKHLSTRAATHVRSVLNMPVFDEPAATAVMKPEASSKLEMEVAELRKQVALLVQRERTESTQNEPISYSMGRESPMKSDSLLARVTNPESMSRTPTFPRPWFCFKCGEDGHIVANCTNEPIPALVRRKNAELRDKHERLKAQQEAHKLSLNCQQLLVVGCPGAENLNKESPIAMTHEVTKETRAKAPEGSGGLGHILPPALVGPPLRFYSLCRKYKM